MVLYCIESEARLKCHKKTWVSMSLKVYSARKSRGWLFLALLFFAFFLTGGFFVYLYLVTGRSTLLISAVASLGIAVSFLVILFSLPSMRYELDSDNLVMRCGLLKYVVPLTSIKRITKRDLEISLWSSLRLPGLALFTVPYADVGKVKMCATSASKDIILIETDRDMYGITPADEEEFIADFRSHIGGMQ